MISSEVAAANGMDRLNSSYRVPRLDAEHQYRDDHEAASAAKTQS